MQKYKSFTIIEIILVIIVIAILAAVVAPSAINAIENAKVVAIINELQAIKKAVLSYHFDTGKWGLACTDLYLVVAWDKCFLMVDDGNPKWNGPYLTEPPGENPFGTGYFYFSPPHPTRYWNLNNPNFEHFIGTLSISNRIDQKIDQALDDGRLDKGYVRCIPYFGQAAIGYLISRKGDID